MFKYLRYRILGTTDEITTCECCGRTDLKKTIVLDDYEGNISHYGETCAAKLMKMKINDFKKEYNSSISQLRKDKQDFIKNHSLTIEMDKEVDDINKIGMSFKERQEKGYTKKWAEIRCQVFNEANKKYMYV